MSENPNIKITNVNNEEETGSHDNIDTRSHDSKTRYNSLSLPIDNDYQSSSYDWSPTLSSLRWASNKSLTTNNSL